MRWTDLPRDRGPADDREGPVVRRGEWDDLKQRLERLPAGHPSSPDRADHVDEDRADDGRADNDRADEDSADDDLADELGDQRVGRSRRTGPDRSAGLPGGHEAGLALGPGRREPYRPWFATGDSPEPWFYGDPDA